MRDILSIHKTGPNTADIIMSVFRIGDFLTSGRTEEIVVSIEDSEQLRLASANLSRMKENNFPGLVTMKFGKGQRYQMDQSIWHELADALFAFTLVVDVVNLEA